MWLRRFGLLLVVCFTLIVSSRAAWALGFELGESKEELKLDYQVDAVEHGTGRVTVNVTIRDQGRLAPLSSVDLLIPDSAGPGHVDLSVSLETRDEEGKLRVRVHVRRDWAERGSIQLKTWTLDGKQTPLTWYYHSIPIAKFLPDAEPSSGTSAVRD